MAECNRADQDIIMDMLVPLDPRDHAQRLRAHLAVTAAALVSVEGARRAYDDIQRVADAVPGSDA